MDAGEIREVLADVFGRNLTTEIINGWVSIRCPLARFTHQKGSDSRPSAGVSIQPNGISVFNCMTCGNKAPFHGMLRKYANYTGEDLDDIIQEMEESAYLGARSLPTWEEARNKSGLQELPILDKAIYLDLYDSAAGHPYLLERFISDATARRLQLMVDPADPADGEERILFPVFSITGELHGFSGRATSDTARLKVRDYHGLPKAQCVLGAHLIAREKPNKILVSEGLFDYANGQECGQPIVAVMHSTFTEAQANILRELGLPTYDFYDNDEAGRKGGILLGEALARYQPVMKTRYPEVWVPDDVSPEGGHWLKDPGEMLPEEFEEMLRDYRLY